MDKKVDVEVDWDQEALDKFVSHGMLAKVHEGLYQMTDKGEQAIREQLNLEGKDAKRT